MDIERLGTTLIVILFVILVFLVAYIIKEGGG